MLKEIKVCSNTNFETFMPLYMLGKMRPASQILPAEVSSCPLNSFYYSYQL